MWAQFRSLLLQINASRQTVDCSSDFVTTFKIMHNYALTSVISIFNANDEIFF